MKRIFGMQWLILSSLLFITAQLSAQTEDTAPETTNNNETTTTAVSPADFRPRIILMPSSVLFFEAGMAIPITRGQVREALEASYAFIEERLTSAEGTSMLQRMEDDVTLAIILNARRHSVAQAFGRLQGDRQYIYLNVFPASSVSSDSTIQNREWRVTSGGPSFWRIRYDLDTQEVFGFSHDHFLN